MAPDVDDVPEATRRDHPGDRALVLEDGVRGDGRAVEDAGDVGRREAGVRAELGEATDHRPFGLVGSGRHLVDVDRAGLGVVEHEVGEGATDVDADNAHSPSTPIAMTVEGLLRGPACPARAGKDECIPQASG